MRTSLTLQVEKCYSTFCFPGFLPSFFKLTLKSQSVYFQQVTNILICKEVRHERVVKLHYRFYDSRSITNVITITNSLPASTVNVTTTIFFSLITQVTIKAPQQGNKPFLWLNGRSGKNKSFSPLQEFICRHLFFFIYQKQYLTLEGKKRALC